LFLPGENPTQICVLSPDGGGATLAGGETFQGVEKGAKSGNT